MINVFDPMAFADPDKFDSFEGIVSFGTLEELEDDTGMDVDDDLCVDADKIEILSDPRNIYMSPDFYNLIFRYATMVRLVTDGENIMCPAGDDSDFTWTAFSANVISLGTLPMTEEELPLWAEAVLKRLNYLVTSGAITSDRRKFTKLDVLEFDNGLVGFELSIFDD